jgi:hypothetical protein
MQGAAAFWPQTLVDWAQIVSAIGTFGAVVVALFLAQRKPVPSLSGYVNIVTLYTADIEHDPEFIKIMALNVGATEARITGIGWQLHHWRTTEQAHAIQFVPSYPEVPNPRLPTVLGHGEQLDIFLSIDGDDNWLDSIADSGLFPERITRRQDLNRLRATVYTSVGGPLVIKPRKPVLDRIWTAQVKYFASRAATKKA